MLQTIRMEVTFTKISMLDCSTNTKKVRFPIKIFYFQRNWLIFLPAVKGFGCSGGFPCSQMNSPETTTKKLPLISRTIGHYEPVCLASRQTLSGAEQTPSTLVSRTESISHNHPSLIQDLVSSSMYQRLYFLIDFFVV